MCDTVLMETDTAPPSTMPAKVYSPAASTELQKVQEHLLKEALAGLELRRARALKAEENARRCKEAVRTLQRASASRSLAASATTRVAARLRPMVEREVDPSVEEHIRLCGPNQLEIVSQPPASSSSHCHRRRSTGGISEAVIAESSIAAPFTKGSTSSAFGQGDPSRTFNVDAAFDSTVNDDEVFASLLREEVVAVLEGEASCFLVCGPPGSGKSHNIVALATRAAEELERQAEAKTAADSGLRVGVALQVLEVTGGTPRDLLAAPSHAAQKNAKQSTMASRELLLPREGACSELPRATTWDLLPARTAADGVACPSSSSSSSAYTDTALVGPGGTAASALAEALAKAQARRKQPRHLSNDGQGEDVSCTDGAAADKRSDDKESGVAGGSSSLEAARCSHVVATLIVSVCDSTDMTPKHSGTMTFVDPGRASPSAAEAVPASSTSEQKPLGAAASESCSAKKRRPVEVPCQSASLNKFLQKLMRHRVRTVLLLTLAPCIDSSFAGDAESTSTGVEEALLTMQFGAKLIANRAQQSATTAAAVASARRFLRQQEQEIMFGQPNDDPRYAETSPDYLRLQNEAAVLRAGIDEKRAELAELRRLEEEQDRQLREAYAEKARLLARPAFRFANGVANLARHLQEVEAKVFDGAPPPIYPRSTSAPPDSGNTAVNATAHEPPPDSGNTAVSATAHEPRAAMQVRRGDTSQSSSSEAVGLVPPRSPLSATGAAGRGLRSGGRNYTGLGDARNSVSSLGSSCSSGGLSMVSFSPAPAASQSSASASKIQPVLRHSRSGGHARVANAAAVKTVAGGGARGGSPSPSRAQSTRSNQRPGSRAVVASPSASTTASKAQCRGSASASPVPCRSGSINKADAAYPFAKRSGAFTPPTPGSASGQRLRLGKRGAGSRPSSVESVIEPTVKSCPSSCSTPPRSSKTPPMASLVTGRATSSSAPACTGSPLLGAPMAATVSAVTAAARAVDAAAAVFARQRPYDTWSAAAPCTLRSPLGSQSSMTSVPTPARRRPGGGPHSGRRDRSRRCLEEEPDSESGQSEVGEQGGTGQACEGGAPSCSLPASPSSLCASSTSSSLFAIKGFGSAASGHAAPVLPRLRRDSGPEASSGSLPPLTARWGVEDSPLRDPCDYDADICGSTSSLARLSGSPSRDSRRLSLASATPWTARGDTDDADGVQQAVVPAGASAYLAGESSRGSIGSSGSCNSSSDESLRSEKQLGGVPSVQLPQRSKPAVPMLQLPARGSARGPTLQVPLETMRLHNDQTAQPPQTSSSSRLSAASSAGLSSTGGPQETWMHCSSSWRPASSSSKRVDVSSSSDEADIKLRLMRALREPGQGSEESEALESQDEGTQQSQSTGSIAVSLSDAFAVVAEGATSSSEGILLTKGQLQLPRGQASPKLRRPQGLGRAASSQSRPPPVGGVPRAAPPSRTASNARGGRGDRPPSDHVAKALSPADSRASASLSPPPPRRKGATGIVAESPQRTLTKSPSPPALRAEGRRTGPGAFVKLRLGGS